MAHNPFGNSNQRHYGAIESMPDVAFAGGLGRGGGLAERGFEEGSSLFSPSELCNLSENISLNIYVINNSRKTLEQEQRAVGTERDSKGLRDRVHITQASCNQIVAQTTSDLARLSEVVRRGDKQQKLQAERLRDEFKQAVTDYIKAQKDIAGKMRQHLLSVSVPGSPEVDEGDEEMEKRQLLAQRQHAQMQKQRELEFETGLMEERAQQVFCIETDILDLNDIMRQLNAMVHIQGTYVNSIEDQIENAHGNVEEGYQQLEKAAGYQNKRRRKILCLTLVAVVILTVIVVFIVIKS